MATQPIWPGSGSYTDATDTPFSFYISDATYVTHSVQTAEWVAKRLGYPIMDVELQGVQMYACFEEAVTEYSSIVNQYNIKENMLKVQGAPTSSNFTHTVVTDLGRAITISEAYGAEVGVGGSVDWKTGYVVTSGSQQVYDLDDWAIVSESSSPIEIKRVFHEAPPAVTRYFDPYAGTGAGTDNVIDSFGWGNYSPGVQFTMMPIYADILKVQAIEFNDQIRKSGYSFELINNKLRIFPIPTDEFKLFFQYIRKDDRWKTLTNEMTDTYESGGQTAVQSDFSNIRYDNMVYSYINHPGQQWIRKYTLALCKELLGIIRSKYGSIPIPGAETTMDGETLRSEATDEKTTLVEQLREMLDVSTGDELMQEEAAEAEATQEILKKVPLSIYIG
jgi:opacity protein-like surface antigen